MILWLVGRIGPDSLENLLRYITVRAGAAACFAFLVALLAGRPFIAVLARLGIGERTDKTDSEDLALAHAAKRGTPTMGGILIASAVVAAVGLFGRLERAHVVLAALAVAAFALLGALDDWIKLRYPDRKGLAGRAKMGGQILISGALVGAVALLAKKEGESRAFTVLVPFVKDWVLDLSWAHGLPYVAFGVFVIVATSNAVNLTDGLDGLAVGLSAIAAATMGAIAYVVGRSDFAAYLWIPYVPGAAELAVVCAALAGACLGFLWYNAHPAEVFMGDTGALAIGGLLGYVAIVTHQELVLPIVCGVFAAETVSVILQVAVFRRTGRRVFLCAPIHHHFQRLGWHESKIVVRFWIVGLLCAVAGLATLKIR